MAESKRRKSKAPHYIMSHVRALRERGFTHLIPITYGYKKPPLEKGYYDKVPGEAEWLRWSKLWVNIGAVLGPNLVCIDPDTRQAVKWWESVLESDPALRGTLTVITASGKPRQFYRIDYPYRTRKITYPGGRMFLEIKTGRQYVVMPPSRTFEHPRTPYRFLDEHAPIAYIPQEKLDRIAREARAYAKTVSFEATGVLALDRRADILDKALRRAGVEGYRGLEHNFFCPFHDDHEHPDMRVYKNRWGQYWLVDFHQKGYKTYKLPDLWFWHVTGREPDKKLKTHAMLYDVWFLRCLYDIGELSARIEVPADVPEHLRDAVWGVMLLAYLRQHLALEWDTSVFPLTQSFLADWIANRVRVKPRTISWWIQEMYRHDYIDLVAAGRYREPNLYRIGPRLAGVIPPPDLSMIEADALVEVAA